jgi:hypothetical protein
MLTIKTISDTATGALNDTVVGLAPARLAGRLGPKLQTLFTDHLRALGPNRQSYPTTHFWEKFARNMRWEADENGVTVVIPPATVQGRQVGLRQAVFGGPIDPQNARFLTIPVSPISYGHLPKDFPGLFVVRTMDGAFLCQRSDAAAAANTPRVAGQRGQGGTAGSQPRPELIFLFQLRSGVMQAGNIKVLPSDEDILQTVIAAAGGAN